MRGVAVAYYLVHSLGAGSDFPERDVMAARNFGAAAKSAGVERIIYQHDLRRHDSETRQRAKDIAMQPHLDEQYSRP